MFQDVFILSRRSFVFPGDDAMKTVTTKTIGWTAALALALPVLARAGEPDAPPLIAQDELQKRLGDPELRLLDVRPRAEYNRGHIPGALWLDIKSLEELAQGDSFADKEAWVRSLAPLGIGPNTEVYLYDANRQHDAGRAWWLLWYASVPRVGLVDGGFPLWVYAGRAVSKEVPTIAARELAVAFHPRLVVSRAEVQSASQGREVQILDVRSGAEYRGDVKPQNGSRAGHIPGARSLDADELVDADGRWLDPALQRARLIQAGIDPQRPLIVYSQEGARSGLAIFALRRLGIPARHYRAGFADWVNDPQAPVVSGNETPRGLE
jgi:thiosulfate/3-mercaptopyruvate sulfurtransferase